MIRKKRSSMIKQFKYAELSENSINGTVHSRCFQHTVLLTLLCRLSIKSSPNIKCPAPDRNKSLMDIKKAIRDDGFRFTWRCVRHTMYTGTMFSKKPMTPISKKNTPNKYSFSCIMSCCNISFSVKHG